MNTVKRRRAHQSQAVELPATFWMLTFSDLLTLLLTFFVMRVAMGQIDIEQFQRVLSVQPPQPPVQAEPRVAEVLAASLSEVFGAPETNVADKVAWPDTDISVRPDGDGALLQIAGSTFITASDELSPETTYALYSIAAVLRDQGFEVEIEGHSDDIPIRSEHFESNWELSSARAIAVARELIAGGMPPERIAVVGYADTKPLQPNTSEAARAVNRRVAVFVRSGADGSD
ncbi:MAG: flagellar motor protein MotB [Bdellovibrionales bacterium]|nr:flagellar motor protein MotB [Bdellovibrionales bacterium]